jgi:hypothetical protein
MQLNEGRCYEGSSLNRSQIILINLVERKNTQGREPKNNFNASA